MDLEITPALLESSQKILEFIKKIQGTSTSMDEICASMEEIQAIATKRGALAEILKISTGNRHIKSNKKEVATKF